ncbi:MAG: hypothetical protein PHS41_08175 [Victivallaceae bacterium]|nr:hypothetical protein [Victivallaceae bacterium]
MSNPYTPSLSAADTYFGNHLRSELWNGTGEPERTGALILAAMDVASLLPGQTVDQTEPLQLLAIYEQAVFLLEKLDREKNPTLLSEQIDGIGSRVYSDSKNNTADNARAAAEFSPRTMRLLRSFLVPRFLRG